MKILSIETSCDDTAISVLNCTGGLKNPSFEVLANFSNSQAKMHSGYGGVYPNLAKNEHLKNLPILFEKVMRKMGRKKIDAIAVTYGPGLEPSLWTGITFAKDLAKKWKVPTIPVNHMEGHILSVFAKAKGKFKIPKVNFPILSLLVSGGHTELILSKKWMRYEIIGKTLDDAAGEAFDKVARMMDLPYPGGPEISRLAEFQRKINLSGTPQDSDKKARKGIRFSGTPQGDGPRTEQIFQQKNCDPEKLSTLSGQISLPRPMLKSKNFDFSFSGLKTAVLYLIKKIGKLNNDKKSAIALEFENAVVETLIYKTLKAKETYRTKTLIVGGGVASNKHLQREMKKTFGSPFFPPKGLSGDNSIMIGVAGYLRFLKNKGKTINLDKIKAEGGLSL